MSTKQNEINDLTTYIKLENDTDDDLTYDNSSEFNNKTDYYSTSTNLNPSAYKGKIEVTSKGRRKIFDGVRWQILCRRSECRKQTNKKSLCITHYKEEYESNLRSSSSSSWSNNLQSFQLPSYQQRRSLDKTKTRLEIEDQNNTISTTNSTDNDEDILVNSTRSYHEGYIKHLQNGRRFILKNNIWQSLCKYDSFCRHIAKYDSLCIKHYQLTQEKRREQFKIQNKDSRKSLSSIFDNHHSKTLNENSKRLKSYDFQTSSSSVTEQFDINSNENSHTSTEKLDNSFSALISKSSKNQSTSESKTDQSVQTDLTIPLCCIIHQEDHLFYSSCQTDKSTSSNLSYDTKPEPQSFDTTFSI